ncbi:MAG: Gfo/Idh/MocA family oxidoreductase [Pseudomonadota bacterium]
MKIGIIGCGNISAAYLRLGPMFKGVDITAVADLDISAAQARAEEFGVRAMSVEDLLGDAGIDAVVNLTIPAAHYEVTSNILAAGKHAYSEKPLVLTLEEGTALAQKSASTGLRVGSAPDTFLGGAHQQARAMIDAGELGEITAGTAHVMGHGMEGWHPNPDFFFQPGAGPMLDIGPYYVTNLIQLLGPVARVAALTSMATPTRTIGSEPRKGEVIPVDTPTNIHALLEFASGATITLSTSWDVWAHRHANMELYGTGGSLFVPDPNFFGGTLERSGQSGDISEVAAWDHPFGRANDGTRANYRCAGLADMMQALDDGRDHRCSIELAVHATEVMTGVLASGEARQFVEMTTTCKRPEALGPDAAAALLSS